MITGKGPQRPILREFRPKKIPFRVLRKEKNKPIKEDVSPSPHFGNPATISPSTCHGLGMPGLSA